MGNDIVYNRDELRLECRISSLANRSDLHLLLYMHKQSRNETLLEPCYIVTRLHDTPVFWQYKPINKNACLNLLYRGALLLNDLPAITRNLSFKDFKKLLKRDMII